MGQPGLDLLGSESGGLGLLRRDAGRYLEAIPHLLIERRDLAIVGSALVSVLGYVELLRASQILITRSAARSRLWAAHIR